MTPSEIAALQAVDIMCSREELATRVAIVARALSSRGGVQVLTGIRLHARAGGLELAATDMELAMRTRMAVEGEAEGAVVVPGRLLAEVVRLLPGDRVRLRYRPDEQTVWIASGSAEYRLLTLPLQDFPRLPAVDEAALGAVKKAQFLEGVARVVRAASRDESRPVLTGVLVRMDEGRLVMAATDSYRLAVQEAPLGDEGTSVDVIIPARALEEVRRLAASAPTLRLGVVDSHAAFQVEDTLVTCRRIDGQFPDYEGLAPKPDEYTLEARIPRGDLIDAVRRVAVMAQRGSALRLQFQDGELILSCRAQDVGEARETMPVTFTGEGLEIGFNPDYFRDGLEAAGGEEVVVKLISPLRAGLIAAAEGGFWYLVMPIRLAG